MTHTERMPVVDTTEARPVAAPAKSHLPSDGSMWVFVLGDLIIFSSYFLIFMLYRSWEPALFLESQQKLSINFGIVNTLALLASSLFVAIGVLAARGGRPAPAMRMMVYAGSCGVLFMVLKAFEWSSKMAQGLTFTTNDFFMFYYMLTGVHLFHVALGLIFLGAAYFELRNPRQRRMSIVETGGIYWHVVDMLWVVIFTLLYIMR